MALTATSPGPAANTNWIVHDPDIDFPAIFSRFDTLLIGRKTFETMRKAGDSGGSMPGVRSFVISRTLKPADY